MTCNRALISVRVVNLNVITNSCDENLGVHLVGQVVTEEAQRNWQAILPQRCAGRTKCRHFVRLVVAWRGLCRRNKNEGCAKIVNGVHTITKRQ